MNKEIEEIIKNAQEALEIDEAEIDIFLDKVSSYLDALEKWREAVKNEEVEKNNAFKEKLGILKELHDKIVSRSNLAKDKVANSLSDISKRAGALKSYIDHVPQRISIAGKREG